MRRVGFNGKEFMLAGRVRESLPHFGGKVRMGGKRVGRVMAKKLRNNPTDAELKLWRYLRHRRIGGQKFRRQHPVGPYVVDFACLEKGLIVEVDGGQHCEQAAYDSERTARLESLGFRVLRFWNNEVLQNVETVLDLIVGALEKCGEYYPHLNPPPRRGRRNRGKILPNPPLQKEGIKRERIDFSLAARNDDKRERRDCRASFHSARNDGVRGGCGVSLSEKDKRVM